MNKMKTSTKYAGMAALGGTLLLGGGTSFFINSCNNSVESEMYALQNKKNDLTNKLANCVETEANIDNCRAISSEYRKTSDDYNVLIKINERNYYLGLLSATFVIGGFLLARAGTLNYIRKKQEEEKKKAKAQE